MSFGFGLIFRSTAGAISAFVGVVFVLPLVLRGISEPDTRYTPTRLLVNSIMSTTNQGGGPIHDFSPGVGLLLMTIYAAIALGVGAAVFMKRDA
jgi:ABC-type phosphate transport system permease subunit